MRHLLAAALLIRCHLAVEHHASHDWHRNDRDHQQNCYDLMRSLQHFHSNPADNPPPASIVG
jgi:hypothetical protein